MNSAFQTLGAITSETPAPDQVMVKSAIRKLVANRVATGVQRLVGRAAHGPEAARAAANTAQRATIQAERAAINATREQAAQQSRQAARAMTGDEGRVFYRNGRAIVDRKFTPSVPGATPVGMPPAGNLPTPAGPPGGMRPPALPTSGVTPPPLPPGGGYTGAMPPPLPTPGVSAQPGLGGLAAKHKALLAGVGGGFVAGNLGYGMQQGADAI